MTPVKNMVYAATRVTMRTVSANADRISDGRPGAFTKAFYRAMGNAIQSKHALVDRMLMLFEFFSPRPFVHDNNRGQYFSVSLATPLPLELLEIRYEEIGDDLPEKKPERLPECMQNTRCFEAMRKVCDWGGGLACN